MAQNEKAVRVKSDLHAKIHAAAATEGRSAANYLDWIVRPIVDAALESAASGGVSHTVNARTTGGSRARRGAGVSPSTRTRKPKPPARPKTRGRAAQEWVGCSEHPDAGAVSVSGGRMACGEPGCPNGARIASA